MAKLPLVLLTLLLAAPSYAQVVRADTEGLQTELRAELSRFAVDSTGRQEWRPGYALEAALGITSNVAVFMSYSRVRFDIPTDPFDLTHADLGARWNGHAPGRRIVPHLDALIVWRGIDFSPTPAESPAPPVRGPLQASGFGLGLGGGAQYYATPRLALGVRAQQTRMIDMREPGVRFGNAIADEQLEGPIRGPSTRASLSVRYTTSMLGGTAVVSAGDTVRVWSRGVRQGEVAELSADSITLIVNGSKESFALHDLDRLERTDWGTGLKTAIAGVAAGGLAALLLTTTRSGAMWEEPFWIIGTATAGGLVGAYSARSPHWRAGTLPLESALAAAEHRQGRVRVQSPAYPVRAGRLIDVTPDSIHVQTSRGLLVYPRDTVRRIELREAQPATTLMALVGAAAGAGAIAAAGPATLGLSWVQGVFYGGALGAALGSVAGSMLQLQGWTTVYERP